MLWISNFPFTPYGGWTYNTYTSNNLDGIGFGTSNLTTQRMCIPMFITRASKESALTILIANTAMQPARTATPPFPQLASRMPYPCWQQTAMSEQHPQAHVPAPSSCRSDNSRFFWYLLLMISVDLSSICAKQLTAANNQLLWKYIFTCEIPI